MQRGKARWLIGVAFAFSLIAGISGCAAPLPEDTEARCNVVVDRMVEEMKASGEDPGETATKFFRNDNCLEGGYGSKQAFEDAVDALQESVEKKFNFSF